MMLVICRPPATEVLRVPPRGSLPLDAKSMPHRGPAGATPPGTRSARAHEAWAAGLAAEGSPLESREYYADNIRGIWVWHVNAMMARCVPSPADPLPSVLLARLARALARAACEPAAVPH